MIERLLVMTDSAFNPINFLQDFCIHNCKAYPVYTDLGFEGVDHCRKFFYRCEFEKYDVIGSGPQKKSAKHEAAKKLVRLLQRDQYFSTEQNEFSSRGELNFTRSLPSPVSSDTATKNAISALSEYYQKKKIEGPKYLEVCDSKGVFITKCLLQGKQTVGRGSSKKKAKLSAASEMCKELNVQFSPCEPCESEDILKCRTIMSSRENCSEITKLSIAGDSKDLSLEVDIITLEKLCAQNQLPIPNFQFESRIIKFSEIFHKFKCNVGSFVGTGDHETVGGAKALAAKDILNEMYKSGYHEKEKSEINPDYGTTPLNVEDLNNNDNESSQGYSSERDDEIEQKQFSWEYPVNALDKLCRTHRSLPSPHYSKQKSKYSGEHFTVKCAVGSIIGTGTDLDISSAKVLAACKVLERLVTEGFPRGDLVEVGNYGRPCFGEKRPIAALCNLCSIFRLNSPEFRITERHKECLVVTCTAANISGKGRDVTRKGAKILAAKEVLQELLYILNIGRSDYEYSIEEENASIGQQNKENYGQAHKTTEEKGKTFSKRKENYNGSSFKPYGKVRRSFLQTNPNARQGNEANSKTNHSNTQYTDVWGNLIGVYKARGYPRRSIAWKNVQD